LFALYVANYRLFESLFETPEMNESYKRTRLFIDQPVQTAVLVRAMWYWAACLIAQMLMAIFIATVSSTTADPKFWLHLQLIILAGIVLLPIILFDLLKLSHRWVGPIYRLRETLRALARGEAPRVVRFREDDYWRELAADMNNISAELARHRMKETSVSPITTASANGSGDVVAPIVADVQSPSPIEPLAV
jgi:hypothetical protein